MQKKVYQKEVGKLELEVEKLKQDIITLTEFSSKIMKSLIIFEEAKIDPNKPIFDSGLVIVGDDEGRVERRLYLIDFLNNYSLRGVISLLEDESFSFSIPEGFKDIIYDFIFCINDVICDSNVCINNKLTEYLKNKGYDIYDHPINYTIAYLDAEKRNLKERIDNLKGNLELIYLFLKEYNRRVTGVLDQEPDHGEGSNDNNYEDWLERLNIQRFFDIKPELQDNSDIPNPLEEHGYKRLFTIPIQQGHKRLRVDNDSYFTIIIDDFYYTCVYEANGDHIHVYDDGTMEERTINREKPPFTNNPYHSTSLPPNVNSDIEDIIREFLED